MVAAHDRGRWSEAAGDRGWPPAVGKMARNGPVAHSRQSKVGDYFSLCRTPCEGSSGCPWWWRCSGVLEGVGGGSGWLKKGKKMAGKIATKLRRARAGIAGADREGASGSSLGAFLTQLK